MNAGPQHIGRTVRLVTLAAALQRCGGAHHAAPVDVSREVPSRQEVIGAMQSVRGRLSACVEGQSASLALTVEFRADGHVASTNVCGERADGAMLETAGPPTCFLEAVRELRVAPFSRPSLTVRYPFALGEHAPPLPARCVMAAEMTFENVP